VQVQNPRMDPRKFDLVVVNRHDEMTGPNVIVTRTALHRATPERMAEAAAVWAPRLAHLPRPLVAVLVGGTNGRFRLDAGVGAELASRLAGMMRADRVGLALTPSRRTDPAVTRELTDALASLGGWVWDGTGENPYFGLLGLADAIVVTMDSVSMVSEAVATRVPVMLAGLPGSSRRIGLFTQGLIADGRVRDFTGRCEMWPVEPLDDTSAAAAEMRRRLDF
jgi:mitochondrial fission protein ELM1